MRRQPVPVWLAAALAACACCLLTAASAQQLVCDGELHQLAMPAGFEVSGFPYAPIINQPDFGCTRRDTSGGIEDNGACGGQAEITCDLGGTVYAPVTHGSGSGYKVAPPSNPIVYFLQPGSAKALTYVQWTVVDVGVAGARLRGVYADSASRSPVSNDYSWTPNGPRNSTDGTVDYGPCSSCVVGEGIVDLNVTAAPGTGFRCARWHAAAARARRGVCAVWRRRWAHPRTHACLHTCCRSMELSQLYEDVNCGASGVNIDGIYWHGMSYKCLEVCAAARGCLHDVLCSMLQALLTIDDSALRACPSRRMQPTCADTDLDMAGQQQWICAAGSTFVAANASSTSPSQDVCCQQVRLATCGRAVAAAAAGTALLTMYAVPPAHACAANAATCAVMRQHRPCRQPWHALCLC